MKNPTLNYRIALIAGLTVLAVVVLWPSFLGGPFLGLSFLPTSKITLGLDLQGGMHLVYTVKVEEAVKNRLDRAADVLQNELGKAGVRGAKIERSGATALKATFPADGREKFQETLTEHLPEFKVGSSQTVGAEVTHELTLDPRAVKEIEESAVEQSLETIRNRIDQFGVTEPVLQRQGERDILIQLPGVTDPTRAKDLLGKTAVLEFKLVRDGVDPTQYVDGKKPLPAGTQLLYEWKKDQFGNLVKGDPYIIESRVLMTGAVLVDARVQTAETPGTWVVGFTLNGEGARRFEELTGASVGRRLAIILDGKVNSAPVIKTKIPGGRGIIEGNFKIEEARDLAIVLRSGSLPAPVEIAEERTVGPSLGQDSIRNGQLSFVVGGAFVVLFMVIYYKKAGVLADVALLFNVIFLLAVMAMFQATLTLPGIAGIVLTLGMAVDANVLINERIREELRVGKSARAAVEAGYERALPAILDSNITTFLAGVILFQFGSGPIKGFAVTLCVGLATSVFSAVVLTRVVYDYLISQRRLQTVSI